MTFLDSTYQMLADTSSSIDATLAHAATFFGGIITVILASVGKQKWAKKRGCDEPSHTGDKTSLVVSVAELKQQVKDHDIGSMSRDTEIKQTMAKYGDATVQLAQTQTILIERMTAMKDAVTELQRRG